MDQMRKCIVSLLDLVGMKELLADEAKRSQAIRAMEGLDRMCSGLSQYAENIDHIYCWNDSALFLSYLEPTPRDMNALLPELSRIKAAIDNECQTKSFVVMVKGMSFMPNALAFRAPMHRGGNSQPVYHYMLASSMAFANCETIVKMFRTAHHDWYVDERIQESLNQHIKAVLAEGGEFKAFPRMSTRKVFTADGYFHQGE